MGLESSEGLRGIEFVYYILAQLSPMVRRVNFGVGYFRGELSVNLEYCERGSCLQRTVDNFWGESLGRLCTALLRAVCYLPGTLCDMTI